LRTYCQRVASEKKRAYRDEIYWGRPVPGFGDPSARLLLLGLAPAAHGANRTGRVFTGDGVGGSGDFLMAALHRTGFANLTTSARPDDGLQLTDAYIAAAVRCAPPDNKPLPEEIARCLAHLESEVAALPNIRVVVALGKIAFDAWLQLLKRRGVAVSPRPQFGHGARIDFRGFRLKAEATQSLILMGSYHPSRQNTNTGKLTPAMMVDVFRKARKLL
jgi:uracil-DNA glycosylase family 4